MPSPRIGLVFCRRQCDKENHGWREGPPLTESWLEFRSVEGLHPPDKSTRTKEEYCLPPEPATRLTLRDWPVYYGFETIIGNRSTPVLPTSSSESANTRRL